MTTSTTPARKESCDTDFYGATAFTRLAQTIGNDPYVSGGAGEALADKVCEFTEDEAEIGGWYTKLMNAIGKGEVINPPVDFTVGRFRVHPAQEGGRYGTGSGFVYGKSLSSDSFGIPVNDYQLYGHGPSLVELYDVSQDPIKLPEGQSISHYFMSTLFGMDSIGGSIGEMLTFGLNGSVPDWTIRGDDLQEVYVCLCVACEQLKSYTERGIYRDYGFGFHAKGGSVSSYIIGESVEEGWWVLVGSCGLANGDSDYYVSDGLLNESFSHHGYPLIDTLKESQADMRCNKLTAIIVEAREGSRFKTPSHLSSDESILRHIAKCMGVPEKAACTAVVNAHAVYERDASCREPEKIVTFKGEVDKTCHASAKLTDSGDHSNRGQDACQKGGLRHEGHAHPDKRKPSRNRRRGQ